jgi:hypothetical protein
MKIDIINPCRSCDLVESDKNNATCLNCRRRVAYVARLDRDLHFSVSRPEVPFPTPRYSLVSRQVRYLAAAPGLTDC